MRSAGEVASPAGSGGGRVSARPAPHDVVAASGWPRKNSATSLPHADTIGGATASRQPRQKTGNARSKGFLSNGGDVRPGERSACRRIAGATSFVPATEKGALLTAVSAPPHPTVGPVAPAHLRDSPRACAEGGVCARYSGTLATQRERSRLWVFLAGPCTGLGGHLDPAPDPRSRPVRLNPEADKLTSRVSHVASQGNRTHRLAIAQARGRPGVPTRLSLPTGFQASRARVVGEKGK